MANEKVISFDLKADFAFFKKPDYNEGLQLSYNMLHKPALLGILGAIVGLEGYRRRGELPQYYQLLKDLPVGIEPLNHERGNYQKTSVKYTNGVGYANADGNLIIEETMLVRPAYRCYLELDLSDETQAKLYEYIKSGHCEYIPYLGKNEFQAWIEKVVEWEAEPFAPEHPFKIKSLFIRSGIIKDMQVRADVDLAFDDPTDYDFFNYFERLPTGFDEILMQYRLGDFAFTDAKLKSGSTISSLFQLRADDKSKIIQFF